MQWITKTLMRQLITMVVLGAMVPLVIITLLSVNYSGKALRESALDKLEAIRVVKAKQIKEFLASSISDMESLAQSDNIVGAFGLLRDYHDDEGSSESGNFHVSSERYKSIYETIDPYFRHYAETYGYHDMFFICATHGHVMYSVAQDGDLGENLKTGTFRESGLGILWKQVIDTGKSAVVDFSLYAPSNNVPAAFLGTPVYDDFGDIFAVLGLRVAPQQVNAIMQENTGLGKTGEAYLVGTDFLMRSDLKSAKVTTTLNSDYKVETEATKIAKEEKSGSKIIRNYADKEVLSSFSHLGLDDKLGLDFEWYVVAEIAVEEALAPITALTERIVTIGLFLVVGASILGYFCSKSISQPLTNLTTKIDEVAGGDLSVEIPHSDHKNEMGVLTRAAGKMMKALREQTSTLTTSSSSIAGSISELSTTASQLATSSTESSATIAEVTATAEEVRHTAHVANQRAEEVTNMARDMESAAQKGHDSTVDTINGMQVIKEEMRYVADSIVKLNEQTLSIGEIIAAVNDLTDQSNLLSVNAAIEAAKAGEYGKGFAVVAQEVKSLAEQSKSATRQVRTILNEIQKATNEAVLATERGNKAVVDGEQLCENAGQAISFLATQVKASGTAAGEIFSSHQQQLEGMDQLAAAMENIKSAALQNTDGAKQLENATTDLDNLGKDLKGLANQFQL